MTEQPETPILDEMLRQCMAYVAEHYVPAPEGVTDEEYTDSDMDQEAVWSRAVEQILGPWEFWENLMERLLTEELTEEQEAIVVRTYEAMTEVVQILAVSVRSDEDDYEEGLGRVGTPAWTALIACDFEIKEAEKEDGALNPAAIVSTYLYNVRGGVMDATGAFHEYVEDDEGDAYEKWAED